ncbi:VWA domain-containing protein [uncultured Paludibaculum sp.]|uniref:VWA domain-containing protein n=1 Tax=uncultured Paludibaculum sp. TaxID=1765020 RepID=UPI002AAB1FFD|nr:VWA domain-containing protein [uncultured Paludibaculum sp.]
MNSPAWFLFVLGAAYGLQPPQMPGNNGDPQFEVSTSLVQVTARVQDGQGLLRGLEAKDFIVYDEDERQTIVSFANESAPIDLIVLLDVSGSMKPIALGLADTALGALSAVHPDDRVALMTFEGKAKLRVPFTGDHRAIAAAIRQVAQQPHSGTTNLYRALIDAAHSLQRGGSAADGSVERRGRVVLMLTDGVAGRATIEQRALRALLEADATVDAMILGPTIEQYLRSLRPPPYVAQDIRRMAESTGGDVLSAAQPGGLRPVLERSRLRYTLYYPQPPAPSGTFRRIRVELAPAVRLAHPDARVRARTGYYCRGAK